MRLKINMVAIGNFFFKYRNLLFIFLYLCLFIPSPQIFTADRFGSHYFLFPIIIGLTITIIGQLIRGVTISLAYIVRGGKDKKVHAEDLVTSGIFNHCRNPLYVGNIMMLLGVGILVNSAVFVFIFIPLFLFIYQAIVLAEENFLRGKFGAQFNAYTMRVNRWLFNMKGLGKTISGMEFKGKRWLIKEYNTQTVWITGILIILLFYYPQITGNRTDTRNFVLVLALLLIGAYYFFIRYMKKSGKWKA